MVKREFYGILYRVARALPSASKISWSELLKLTTCGLFLHVPVALAEQQPVIVSCKEGQLQGYSTHFDRSDSTFIVEADRLHYSWITYDFSVEGEVSINHGMGQVKGSVSRDIFRTPTVIYNYGNDIMVDTVFPDGNVISTFGRSFVPNTYTNYVFQRKCEVLK